MVSTGQMAGQNSTLLAKNINYWVQFLLGFVLDVQALLIHKKTMKKHIVIVVLSLLSLGCSKSKLKTSDYLAVEQLSEEEVIKFKKLLIRDIGKLPKKANSTTKNESKFDDHYNQLVQQHDLIFYYPSPKSDTIYFAINRVAPSLYQKKVTIGGKTIIQNGNVEFLEESFRTFKMKEDELYSKTEKIFLSMLQQESLSAFKFKHTKPEEYIEFPDEFTWYNSQSREWESTREVYFWKDFAS